MTADDRTKRLPVKRDAPAWCYDPLLRVFVMGNALAAPAMLLLWVWSR